MSTTLKTFLWVYKKICKKTKIDNFYNENEKDTHIKRFHIKKGKRKGITHGNVKIEFTKMIEWCDFIQKKNGTHKRIFSKLGTIGYWSILVNICLSVFVFAIFLYVTQ